MGFVKMDKFVKQELRNLQEYKVRAKNLAILAASGNPLIIEQYENIQNRIDMISSWLELLDKNELYVIQLHYLDGISWNDIETEYWRNRKEAPKAASTLRGYQTRAIEKISNLLYPMQDFLDIVFSPGTENH